MAPPRLLAEMRAVALGAAACHAWCAGVMALLGFGPAQTAFLAVPSLFLAVAASADRALSRALPFLRPMGAAGSAVAGFMMASAGTAAALVGFGERVTAAGNLADVVLSGLALGVPGGLGVWLARPRESIVDRRARRL